MKRSDLGRVLAARFVLASSPTLASAIYAATQSPNIPAFAPWYSAVRS